MENAAQKLEKDKRQIGKNIQNTSDKEKDQDTEGHVPNRMVWVAVLPAAEGPDRMRTLRKPFSLAR